MEGACFDQRSDSSRAIETLQRFIRGCALRNPISQ
jgi:hypothetical protein